jgi:hypothetical protein
MVLISEFVIKNKNVEIQFNAVEVLSRKIRKSINRTIFGSKMEKTITKMSIWITMIHTSRCWQYWSTVETGTS